MLTPSLQTNHCNPCPSVTSISSQSNTGAHARQFCSGGISSVFSYSILRAKRVAAAKVPLQLMTISVITLAITDIISLSLSLGGIFIAVLNQRWPRSHSQGLIGDLRCTSHEHTLIDLKETLQEEQYETQLSDTIFH